MRPLNPSHSYRRVSMQTAPPGHLVLMLYQGVIRFLEQALSGFTLDDPVEFNQTISNNVIRAQEIIRELDVSLDLAAGGELAIHLRRLYDYFDRRLMESNMKKETDGIHEVISRVSTLRDSWASMLKGQANSAEDEPAEALPAGSLSSAFASYR